MTALGVYGDPDGWQNAGYTIRAAVDQLTQELDSADAGGGSGLRRTWSGPVADAFQNHWSGRYDRYGDLLYQAGRAASALIDFGGRLIDLQRQASLLEHQGLSAGLHLTMDGLGFMLPFGHENLVQEAQATLHYFLGESEREIAAMWTDIRTAVCDVVTVLESVAAALEDFLAIEAGIGAAVAGYVIHDFLDPKELAGNIRWLAEETKLDLRYAADRVGLDAWLAEKEIGKLAPADQPAMEQVAGQDATRAKFLSTAARADEIEGGLPGLVVANVATAGITTWDVTHGGWYKAMVTDKDASLVAGTATDDTIVAVASFIPGGQVVDTPVGMAVSGFVSMGVGALVQWQVDAVAKDPRPLEAALRDFANVGSGIESLL